MLGISPLAVGITGLQFALFGNAFMLLGIDSTPLPGHPSPAKTVGIAASLIGAIGLIFQGLWLVIGAPFGREGAVVATQLTFSAISAMYGFIWLGAAFVQIFDWDLRPLGNIALGCLIMQLFEMAIIANWGLTTHLWLVELVLLSYVAVLYGFWRATHGKMPTRPVGVLCLVAFVLSFYFQFWASGILPTPP